MIKILEDDFKDLLTSLNEMKAKVQAIKDEVSCPFRVYTNKDLRELFGVQDKLIRKYRDEGKLSFHKEGDKYWYTQKDVDDFLSNNFYEAYSIAS